MAGLRYEPKTAKGLLLIFLVLGQEMVRAERIMSDLQLSSALEADDTLESCASVVCAVNDEGECPSQQGCCVMHWTSRFLTGLGAGYKKECSAATPAIIAHGLVFHSKKLTRHVFDFGQEGGIWSFWGKNMFSHLGAFMEVMGAAKMHPSWATSDAATAYYTQNFQEFKSKLEFLASAIGEDPEKDVFAFTLGDFGNDGIDPTTNTRISQMNAAKWFLDNVRRGIGEQTVVEYLGAPGRTLFQALEAVQFNEESSVGDVCDGAVKAKLDMFPAEECMDLMDRNPKNSRFDAIETEREQSFALLEFASRHKTALLDVSGEEHKDVIGSYLDHRMKGSLIQLGDAAVSTAEAKIFQVVMLIVAIVFLCYVSYWAYKSWKETTGTEKRAATGMMWEDFKYMFRKAMGSKEDQTRVDAARAKYKRMLK